MEATQDKKAKKPSKSDSNWGNGNLPNRGGRPKGAVSIASGAAIKKLEELGFNPLEKLIEQYSVIQQQIDFINNQPKPSQLALSNLENLKKSIAETLMKYSYKPVPTNTEQVIEHKTPLKITLEGIEEDEPKVT